MKAFRAKDEIRTRDPDLGKVVLYQLSYFRVDNVTKIDILFNFPYPELYILLNVLKFRE